MAVKKWVAKVDTESTYPEEHLFTKDAETIAKHLASKKVSPKGPASGMRMLNYYINRGGKNLTPRTPYRTREGEADSFRNHCGAEGNEAREEAGTTEGRGEEESRCEEVSVPENSE